MGGLTLFRNSRGAPKCRTKPDRRRWKGIHSVYFICNLDAMPPRKVELGRLSRLASSTTLLELLRKIGGTKFPKFSKRNQLPAGVKTCPRVFLWDVKPPERLPPTVTCLLGATAR